MKHLHPILRQGVWNAGCSHEAHSPWSCRGEERPPSGVGSAGSASMPSAAALATESASTRPLVLSLGFDLRGSSPRGRWSTLVLVSEGQRSAGPVAPPKPQLAPARRRAGPFGSIAWPAAASAAGLRVPAATRKPVMQNPASILPPPAAAFQACPQGYHKQPSPPPDCTLPVYAEPSPSCPGFPRECVAMLPLPLRQA